MEAVGQKMEQRVADMSEADAQRLLLSKYSAKEILVKLARNEPVHRELRLSLGAADEEEDPLQSMPCPWNERFQALLDLPDSPSKFSALGKQSNLLISSIDVQNHLIESTFASDSWKRLYARCCGVWTHHH